MNPITQSQKHKLYWEALFCSCYKADLKQAVCRNNGMTYFGEELRKHLLRWFETKTIPKSFRLWLMNTYIVNQISDWLLEGEFHNHFFKHNIIDHLNTQEADYIIKKFIALREKIQKRSRISRTNPAPQNGRNFKFQNLPRR